MAPVKSSAIRTLGSILSPTRHPRSTSAVSRGITVTSQKSAPFEHVQKPALLSTILQSGTRIQSLSSNLPKVNPFPEIGSPYSSPLSPIPRQKPTTFSNSFDYLLNSVAHSLSTTIKPDLQTLHSLLRSYTSQPSEWSKYAHANSDKQYTRNLVTEIPGIFNLLILVWTPGRSSPIHDHADSHCLMKVLKGTLKESRFKIPKKSKEGPLEETSRLYFGKNKVAYIADNVS
jgi:cysteine dioxygenase